MRVAALNDIEGQLPALEVAAFRDAGFLVDDELVDEILESPNAEEVTARFEAFRAGRDGA